MITTSDTITLDASTAFASGQGRQLRAPDLVCLLRLVDMQGDGRHQVEVQGLDDNGVYMGGTVFEYTTANVNGQTGSGGDDAAKYFNCIEKLVKIDLETLNVSATFTIV